MERLDEMKRTPRSAITGRPLGRPARPGREAQLVGQIKLWMTERDKLWFALKDLLGFYDRVTGKIPDGHAWSAADVKRLAEIRKLIGG